VTLRLIHFDVLKEILSKSLPVKMEFCYIYDDEKQLLSSIIPSSSVYSVNELDQLMHEIFLAELMFNRHQKMLGSLQNIICNFSCNLLIGSFPLQDAVLIIAFDKEKLFSTAENNLVFRKIEELISASGLSPQNQYD
jgi:hypothetical protein